VAGFNYETALCVQRWPLVEVLHAMQARMKEQALTGYNHALLMWAATAPHSKKKIKQPMRPGILSDD
jgi:hypothetical protein